MGERLVVRDTLSGNWLFLMQEAFDTHGSTSDEV